ncbi:MAG: hypothetical protein U0165_11110 [Polyangiaceae bacterium]
MSGSSPGGLGGSGGSAGSGRSSTTPVAPSVRRSKSSDSLVAQHAHLPPGSSSLSSTSMPAIRSSPSSRPPPPASTPSGTFRATRSGEYAAVTLPRRESPRPPKLEVDFGLMTPATRVVEEILGLIPGEKLLIVHDKTNFDIARAFEQAAETLGAKVERIDLEAMAPRPWISLPTSVVMKIRGAQASALAVRHEDGEYELRSSFVHTATASRLRHVHMVGLSRRVFQASMVTPCTKIFDLLRKVRTAMRPTSRISVRSASGTNLEIDMAPHLRWMDNGSPIRPGEWATLPFGSVVSSPANVNGVYVADASISGPMGTRRGLLAARPARITFENARVRKVESSDSELREHIEKFAAEGQGRDRVGMVVVGANVGLMPPVGEFIHDEHTPGVHLGLGENFASVTGATWATQGQLAFAMASADVDVDGSALIRQGRYVRFV